MTPPLADPQRPIVLSAVRGLIADARSERARLAARSPERQFYLAVEAAAQEVLHPELAEARAPHWLEVEAIAVGSAGSGDVGPFRTPVDASTVAEAMQRRRRMEHRRDHVTSPQPMTAASS